MGEELIIRYDDIGSFLFLEMCPPYEKQDSNEIEESVVARFSLETGEMESVEILFFDSWLKKEGEIRIPVSAELRLADAVIPAASARSVAADAPMTVRYDFESDTLSISQPNAHPRQRQVEIADGAFAGINSETGEIEKLVIRPFKARMEREGKIVLPIEATLRLVEPSPVPD